MHIKVEVGVAPQIGKHYIFFHEGHLKIGICIKNPSQKPSYDWAMQGVDDDKIYYPYCADIIDDKCKVQHVLPAFEYSDILI